MYPSGATITPEPASCSRCGCGGRRSGSQLKKSKDPWFSFALLTTTEEILTMAGTDCFTTGAKPVINTADIGVPGCAAEGAWATCLDCATSSPTATLLP